MATLIEIFVKNVLFLVLNEISIRSEIDFLTESRVFLRQIFFLLVWYILSTASLE